MHTGRSEPVRTAMLTGSCHAQMGCSSGPFMIVSTLEAAAHRLRMVNLFPADGWPAMLTRLLTANSKWGIETGPLGWRLPTWTQGINKLVSAAMGVCVEAAPPELRVVPPLPGNGGSAAFVPGTGHHPCHQQLQSGGRIDQKQTAPCNLSCEFGT